MKNSAHKKLVPLAASFVFLVAVLYVVYPRHLYDGMYTSTLLGIPDGPTEYWQFKANGQIRTYSANSWAGRLGPLSPNGPAVDVMTFVDKDTGALVLSTYAGDIQIVPGFNWFYFDVALKEGTSWRFHRRLW